MVSREQCFPEISSSQQLSWWERNWLFWRCAKIDSIDRRARRGQAKQRAIGAVTRPITSPPPNLQHTRRVRAWHPMGIQKRAATGESVFALLRYARSITLEFVGRRLPGGCWKIPGNRRGIVVHDERGDSCEANQPEDRKDEAADQPEWFGPRRDSLGRTLDPATPGFSETRFGRGCRRAGGSRSGWSGHVER